MVALEGLSTVLGRKSGLFRALLELSENPIIDVREVVEKSNLSEARVYGIISELSARGLIKKSIENDKVVWKWVNEGIRKELNRLLREASIPLYKAGCLLSGHQGGLGSNDRF